jgi:hypothetical protein
MITVSGDTAVRWWSLRDESSESLTHNSERVSLDYAVALSPDGSTLVCSPTAAAAVGRSELTKWHVGGGSPARTGALPGPGRNLSVAAVDDHGHVAAGAEGAVIVWDTDPDRMITRLCQTVGSPDRAGSPGPTTTRCP